MGGPNYATPQPVTQPSGKTIIWDWNKREFVPYTAPGAKSAGPPPTPGSGSPGGAPASGAPESGATAAPAPEPTGSPSPGFGFPLKPRRRPSSQNPTGTSLLTLLSDWGK